MRSQCPSNSEEDRSSRKYVEIMFIRYNMHKKFVANSNLTPHYNVLSVHKGLYCSRGSTSEQTKIDK